MGDTLESGFFLCVICRFGVPLDDTTLLFGDGTSICLRCYSRETHTEHLMPKRLRSQLISILAGIS